MTPEHLYYNALALAEHGNYQRLHALFLQYKSWGLVYEKAGSAKMLDPEESWRSLERHKVSLLLPTDADFPVLLKEIPWAPHGLYVRGTLPKSYLGIAIVGTRKASDSGRLIAEEFTKELIKHDIVIVSGLAFGIDVTAHQTTVLRNGKAVAVLAGGVENITPRTNERVGEEILKKDGCIISEYPIGTQPLARFFIERNRIVSGLSKGILVIEAPSRSGTLSTARFAIDQNREVFVVPGGINNPNFSGSNNLIKQGAQLVTSPEDIIQALGLATDAKQTQPLPFLDENQQHVVNIVSQSESPITSDSIAKQAKLDIRIVNETLALLTIEGVIKEKNGGYYL